MTAMSSAGLRCAAAAAAPPTAAGRARLTDSACSPRAPSTTPNSTREPGLRAGTPGGQRVAVHEDVAAVVAGEEAEALVGVVPLDLAGRHG